MPEIKCELYYDNFKINKFYNMDCIKAMAEFPDKYFELAIVDPPYGIGEDGSKAEQRTSGDVKDKYVKPYKPFSGGDKEPPPPEYFKELFRVSKNQIIWGANHFISKIPYDSSCWIVWDKLNGKSDFADCELAWTSFKTSVRKFSFLWNGFQQGDIKNKENRIHPTQKPIPLYNWILSKYAKKGDKILDTHVGSASSLISCHRMGYEFIGYEIDEYYYNLANERLKKEMLQPRLEI